MKEEAPMLKVTVVFGPDNRTSVTIPDGSPATVGEALRRAKLALGFGDNVTATIDTVVQDVHSPIQDGDVISVRVAANQKAA